MKHTLHSLQPNLTHKMAKIFLNYLFIFFTKIICLVTLFPRTQGLNQTLDNTSSLVPSPKTILNYHGGPLLTRPINIYLIWYGSFYRNNRAPITDFIASFDQNLPNSQAPSVQTWWHTVTSYKDRAGNRVSSAVRVAKQIGDINYSLGKNIKRTQIGNYVKTKINSKTLPLDPNGIYLLLTSKNVAVEGFCMNSCGYHANMITSGKNKVVYAHVGDPSRQCPGSCAWPYAVSANGPPGKPLVAPNGVGQDGMVANIAAILAGAATDPYGNGYFEGDWRVPLEAVGACRGVFGVGAYPGYPGKLMEDKMSKASYNAYGVNGRKFLLPATWDPIRKNCKA